MKKLEDIPKKQIFTVPDRYFEELPSKIQDRITAKHQTPGFFERFKVSYTIALAALAILVILIWIPGQKKVTAEEMLASISTEELIAYLNDIDISDDELFDAIEFNTTDVEDLEDEVFRFEDSDIIILEELNDLPKDTL